MSHPTPTRARALDTAGGCAPRRCFAGSSLAPWTPLGVAHPDAASQAAPSHLGHRWGLRTQTLLFRQLPRTLDTAGCCAPRRCFSGSSLTPWTPLGVAHPDAASQAAPSHLGHRWGLRTQTLLLRQLSCTLDTAGGCAPRRCF